MRQSDAKTLIDHDIGKAAEIIRLVRGGRPDLVRFRRDPYAGREHYSDVTGAELRAILRRARPDRIGFDTEGDPDEPFSLQVSPEPGVGYMLRYTQDDFSIGVEILQELADRGCTFITHDAGTPRGTGYDTQVSRTCGLELRDATFANTMYRAFALRIEPKGLKALLWRWCGMKQEEYMSLVEGIARERQIEYIKKVASRSDEAAKLLAMVLMYQMLEDRSKGISLMPAIDEQIRRSTWPRIPPRVERENNGTLSLKKFGKLEARAKLILGDIDKDKRDKDDEPVDPAARWGQLEPELRALAEAEIGELPKATLDDVPLDQAIYYSARDADGTLRLDIELEEECRRMGVEGVCRTGFEVLPIFEEMQFNKMPASRREFIALSQQVDRDMQQLQARLSYEYFDGRPINPAPNTKDVEVLVRRLGITGLKTTKNSKRPSTSMKSLEYLAPKFPALSLVGEWRRRQKVLHTYCIPALEMADRQGVELRSRGIEESDLFLVSYQIKPVTIETRRIATENLSMLNIPVRTKIGQMVRACYMTTADDDPDDPTVEVFGEWDYSSQEVRVTAHVTNDDLLCSIMRDPKRKIHMETASRVFGKPIDQIDEVGEKIPAKTAFFGMLYGMQGPGLLDLFRSYGLENWPLDQCEKLIAEVFRIYPGLLETIRRVQRETLRTGMVRDLYGHIRYLPNIWSDKRGEANEAARQAFSHLVQGTAQGMTQSAMAALRQPLRELRPIGVKWALQIHDSIMLRMPRWLFSVVNQIMTHNMTQNYGLRLKVPVTVDGHTSINWANLK
jgi:DNA polymerase I-like protein with 3'-5' exonuclease and polymerase domains